MSDQQWYYLDAAGQQQGPVAVSQLQALVSSGQVTAQTQVWTDGLAEWVPASQVDGLIPTQPAVAVAPAPATTGMVNPYAPSATATAATPQAGGDYPIPMVNKINFGLYLTCLLVGFALYIFAVITTVASSPTAEEMLSNPNALEESRSGGGLALVMTALGLIGIGIASILQLIAIYRVWFLLRPGGGSVSPGSAVGFLFIPLFGAIWMIIIGCKLPGEWNSIVSRYQNTAAAPRLSIGSFICMLFIPIIGQILWMKEISNGINFMVSQRLLPTPQQGQAAPGGMRLY